MKVFVQIPGPCCGATPGIVRINVGWPSILRLCRQDRGLDIVNGQIGWSTFQSP